MRPHRVRISLYIFSQTLLTKNTHPRIWASLTVLRTLNILLHLTSFVFAMRCTRPIFFPTTTNSERQSGQEAISDMVNHHSRALDAFPMVTFIYYFANSL